MELKLEEVIVELQLGNGSGSKLGLINDAEAIGIWWTQRKVIARLMVSLQAKKRLF